MIKNTRTDHFVLDSDPYSLLASMSSKRTPHENKSVPLPARWLVDNPILVLVRLGANRHGFHCRGGHRSQRRRGLGSKSSLREYCDRGKNVGADQFRRRVYPPRRVYTPSELV